MSQSEEDEDEYFPEGEESESEEDEQSYVNLVRQSFKRKKELSLCENYYLEKNEIDGSNNLFSEPSSEKQVSDGEENEENNFVNDEVSIAEINMSDKEDEGEDDAEHEIHYCNQKNELLVADKAEEAVISQFIYWQQMPDG